MARRYQAETEFRAIDRMSGPLGRMESRVQRFSRAASAAIGRADRAANFLGSGIQKITGVSVAAGTAIGAIGWNVIQTGAKFEKSLMGAAARFPGVIRRGSVEYLRLRDAALKTGAVTEFTAQQTAEALTSLAQAGFDVNQAIASLPGVVDLATAAEVDLGDASLMAADSLDAFGMKAKDSTKLAKNLADIMDTMAMVANASTVDFKDLYATIQAGGGVAKVAGASMHDFLAMAGIMAPVAKAEKAGMMLKNIFLNLKAGSGPGTKELAKLGFSAERLSKGLRDPIKLFGELKEAMKKSENASRAIRVIIGKEAFPGFSIMLDNIEALKKLRRETDAAGGAAERMAAALRETLQGSLDILKSSIEGVALALFFQFNQRLETVVNTINDYAVATQKVVKENSDLIKIIGKDGLQALKDFAMVMAALVAVYITLKTVVLAAAAAQGAWTLAMGIAKVATLLWAGVLKLAELAVMGLNIAMWANPVGLIVAGVVALIAVIVLAIVFWKQWTGAVIKFFKTLGKIVKGIWDFIAGTIRAIGDLFTRVSNIIGTLGFLGKKVKAEVEITEKGRKAPGEFGAGAGAGGAITAPAEGGGKPAIPAAVAGAQTSTTSRTVTESNATLTIENKSDQKVTLSNGRGGPAPKEFKPARSGAF